MHTLSFPFGFSVTTRPDTQSVGSSSLIIETLRSRTGERTTARQTTVRTGLRSSSHAMDK